MERERGLRPKDVRRLLVLALACAAIGSAAVAFTGRIGVGVLAAVAVAVLALLQLSPFEYIRARYLPAWMRGRRRRMSMHMSRYYRD